MEINGGRLAARTLARAGVDTVFALHGGHLDTFFAGCRDEGIRLLDCRHEAAAVNAADAYARTSGRLGTAAVTSGPGLTNAVAGITNAAADGSAVLVITSSPPLGESETLELQGGLDLMAMLSTVAKWTTRVYSTARVADLVGLAVRHALATPRGPAIVDLPIDVAFTTIDEARIPPPGTPSLPARAAAVDAQIATAAELIDGAERPVVVVGEGSFQGPLADALTRFAEAADVPVFHSSLATAGLPAHHPRNAGGLQFLALVGQTPDVVILAGARQGLFTGGRSGALVPSDARIVQLDADGAELGRLYPVDVALLGDCGATLEKLAVARPWRKRPQWCASATSMRSGGDLFFADAAMEDDGIHPYAAAKAVLAEAPADTVLVLDGGESAAWADWALGHTDISARLSLGYQGHLGVGQGFAIGAQVAHPDRRVLQITGDGAIGFHLQEWDTMVRHRLPIVTVIFNNACWGMSIHGQEAMGGPGSDIITRLSPTAYEAVARGFGCHGESVPTLDDLAPAMRRAFASDGPAVVNVRIAASVVHPVTIALLGDLTSQTEIVVPYYQNIPK